MATATPMTRGRASSNMLLCLQANRGRQALLVLASGPVAGRLCPWPCGISITAGPAARSSLQAAACPLSDAHRASATLEEVWNYSGGLFNLIWLRRSLSQFCVQRGSYGLASADGPILELGWQGTTRTGSSASCSG
jgi:hypothetical protein